MLQGKSPAGDKQPGAAGAFSAELTAVLATLGRTLGVLSVYGADHPSAGKAIEEAFAGLQKLLNSGGKISLGSIKGELTVNGKPVTVKDAPVKALEKRLAALQISHLALNKGLPLSEFKKLLAALAAGTDRPARETLAKSGLTHVSVEDVEYVALRKGETKAVAGTGGGTGSAKPAGGTGGAAREETLPAQVSQIVAFLKGEAGSAAASADVKDLLSEPEKLGQMILEAAAVRQRAAAVEGENLADIVLGCLRRTYDGMRTEPEFETARGKATLAQTMLLLEKSVLDRIRGTLGKEQPGLDRRMMAGIRAMEKEREFDLLSTHYAEECEKRDRVKEKMVALIQQQGPEKARERLAASGLSVREWQQLMIESSGTLPGGAGGADMGAIAAVLEKLDGLMQMADRYPEQAKAAVGEVRRGINSYTERAGARMDEMEKKVQQSERQGRDKLLLEISKLTLSLMQPLTVINGSLEAALVTADPALHKDLLDLAYQSGQSLDAMTKRMIALTGYPALSEADSHLTEWKESQ